MRRFKPKVQYVEPCRVNQRIRASEVRVIDENGKQLGILQINRGIQLAMDRGLDLVEVQANANPPVCKILDYGKYKYELKKKSKESKKHQQTIKQKEVQVRYNTSEHDIEVKRKRARKFLEEKYKVFFKMRLRGRERQHVDMAKEIYNKIIEDLSDVGHLDGEIKQEGNSLNMLLFPGVLKQKQHVQEQKIDVAADTKPQAEMKGE